MAFCCRFCFFLVPPPIRGIDPLSTATVRGMLFISLRGYTRALANNSLTFWNAANGLSQAKHKAMFLQCSRFVS